MAKAAIILLCQITDSVMTINLRYIGMDTSNKLNFVTKQINMIYNITREYVPATCTTAHTAPRAEGVVALCLWYPP